MEQMENHKPSPLDNILYVVFLILILLAIYSLIGCMFAFLLKTFLASFAIQMSMSTGLCVWWVWLHLVLGPYSLIKILYAKEKT